MTPKEKAKELVNKFRVLEISPKNDICVTFRNLDLSSAKQCALICVGEILNIQPPFFCESRTYWVEVKQELEKL